MKYRLTKIIFSALVLFVATFADCRAAVKLNPAAVREAKALEKEGWKGMGKPIAEQLDECIRAELQISEDGLPRYVIASAEGEGLSIPEAEAKARALSQMQIAADFSSRISAVTTSSLSTSGGKSLSEGEQSARIESSAKFNNAACLTLMSLYKTQGPKFIVRVRLGYDTK